MSDDSRWMVDMSNPYANKQTYFGVGIQTVIDAPRHIVGLTEVREAFIELIAEIERLQGENIALRDEVKAASSLYKKMITQKNKLLKERELVIDDLADRLAAMEPANPHEGREGALMRGCQEGCYHVD